jgi:glycosyltransferase involved in cell wall biosynthesis
LLVNIIYNIFKYEIMVVLKLTNKATRILHVFASLDRAGAETMLMNIYRSLDRNKVQFDFVVEERLTEYAFEKEVRSLGGRVFYSPKPTFFKIGRYIQFWWELFSDHTEYRIIHAHHTSPAFLYLFLAKMKSRKTLAHSHISGGEKSFKTLLKIISRFPLRYIADKLVACSDPAATWMFGGKGDVLILKNAIDISGFHYTDSKRLSTQQRYNISGEPIILHVGRFDNQKNHYFLIDAFKFYLGESDAAKLYLIGEGPLKASIEAYALKLGLRDNVVFVGVSSNIQSWMCAADVFLFPSKYEGLGLVLIEAQAAGLPCVVSDGVPREVAVTDLVEFVPLKSDIKSWASAIDRAYQMTNERSEVQGLRASGYDVRDTSKLLIETYEEMMV